MLMRTTPKSVYGPAVVPKDFSILSFAEKVECYYILKKKIKNTWKDGAIERNRSYKETLANLMRCFTKEEKESLLDEYYKLRQEEKLNKIFPK